MHRLLSCIVACALLSVPALAATGFTTVTGSKIVDASGNPLASGTVTFKVVDAGANPMSVRVGGGGQTIMTPATGTVINGAFSVPVVDVSMTSPSMPCIAVTVVDNSTGLTVYQNPCIQPTGPAYSLDNFTTNTSAIAPKAGDTVLGDLFVNGAFGTTGAFQPGSVYTSIVDSNVISGNVNGVLNATRFPGPDLGAQINAAYASCQTSCTVQIPPGNYSFSTTVIMPNTLMTTLDMTTANLTYTGSTYAIMTSQGPFYGVGGYQGMYFIRGGHLFGTSSALGGIVMAPAVNSTTIRDMAINGFTAGDGILDVGTNSATIEDNKVINNFVGLHLMASPGYASNNVLVVRNNFGNNAWGSIDGDVSQWPSNAPPWKFSNTTGVSSPNYGNVFQANVFESNTLGAAIEGLTVGTQYTGNYIEDNPRGFVLGMTEMAQTSAQLQRLYGISATNGGTARDVGVLSNYFTTAGSINDLIEIRAASANISWNATDGNSPSKCFVDLYISSAVWMGVNDTSNVSALKCQGGNPGWNLADTLPAPLNVGGSLTSTTLSTSNVFNLNTSTTVMPGAVAPPVGTLGPITIYSTSGPPSGFCHAGDINIGTFGFAVCQNGNWTVK